MTPLFILDFQRGTDDDSLCQVSYISECGVYFKWILSFRCHCHLVKYRTMSLSVCSLFYYFREQLWRVGLHDTVLDICCHQEDRRNKLFAGLADGTVAVLEV